MRRTIVAGNWKMHGSLAFVAELLSGLIVESKNFQQIDWMVFPPFVYLQHVVAALSGVDVACGAQNLSAHLQGAFTGEVSGEMLSDIGCSMVLVGHSERRHLYSEDSNTVAKKFVLAQQCNLTPILCVGETQTQREQGLTWPVLEEQLRSILSQVGSIGLLDNSVIAYEPVWAIGTGLTATPEQAQEVHSMIREYLAEKDKDIAQRLRILYGGSVKPGNAAALFAMDDIDGFLVGGASLNSNDFLQIGKAIEG